jgi:hypothetical protein
MDLFIVQVDGLDVAITDCEMAAVEHARQIAAEDPAIDATVLRVQDGSLDVIERIPAAAAIR